MTGPRARFRVFTMERWLAGGEGRVVDASSGSTTWPGLAALSILLIPLLPTVAGMLLLSSRPAGRRPIAIGCVGLALTVLLLIVGGDALTAHVDRTARSSTWAVTATARAKRLRAAVARRPRGLRPRTC